MLLVYIAILRSSRPEVFCKKDFLKHFAKFIGKLVCWSLFFTEFYWTPILYNICEWLFLVLARIGLVWRATNLSMFFIIVCKSVPEVLGRSFQLILQWWAPNQGTNVVNAMLAITEVYFDTQTFARGNTGILSVWLTSFKRCIRACKLIQVFISIFL